MPIRSRLASHRSFSQADAIGAFFRRGHEASNVRQTSIPDAPVQQLRKCCCRCASQSRCATDQTALRRHGISLEEVARKPTSGMAVRNVLYRMRIKLGVRHHAQVVYLSA